MSPEMKERVQEEWRELGFYYDFDSTQRAWRIVGSANGLTKFAALLEAYAANPRNAEASAHEHFGPYSYLEIGTWAEPVISNHWIAGPLRSLLDLAASIRARLEEGKPGQVCDLGGDFAPESNYRLHLEIRESAFDPASADEQLGSPVAGAIPIGDRTMLALKIENYERDHGPGTFPKVLELNRDKVEEVLVALKQALGMTPLSSGLECVQAIQVRGGAVGDLTEDASADFQRIFAGLGLELPERVYLNWRQFEALTEIQLEDLIRIFDDIWYPSADDLDIVDPELRWLVSVSHYGAVTLLRLGSSSSAPKESAATL
jgi:hypothetical protein